MIKYLRFFDDPESRQDKLRRMWTRVMQAEQRQKQKDEIEEKGLDYTL